MEQGLEYGFGIHVQEPYMIDDKVVSSTWIRQLISEGRMEEAARLMGRMYAIAGEVIVGNRLGRTIGFPTCNLIVDETMITPPNGVYISMCTCKGNRYHAVTNVGNKPTIGSYAKNIETHIFDFDDDVYGERIRVEFIRHTRPERKFGSVEELKEQIERDSIDARVYHRQHGTV
jgi:riboflavin kinase/FMN adenylyltransferase